MRSYRKEKTIIGIVYLLSFFLLYKFVPKDKTRHAAVAFLFKQALTWLFGLIVVEKKLIDYPYCPIFKKAYKGSFSFEYFFYPVLCVLFNIHYPAKSSIVIKALYHLSHTSFITGIEVLTEKYTKLIRYKKWKWYYSFTSIWFVNYLSHVFYQWFFRDIFMKRNSVGE